MKYFFTAIAIVCCLGFTFIGKQNKNPLGGITSETRVNDLLITLGQSAQQHYRKDIDPVKAKMGEDIVKKGNTTKPDGITSELISVYFKCTHCHNTVRETDDLADNNPDNRLQYAKANNILYLPGSTFFGIVNRTTWYNGDYVKKYGDLAIKAHDNLSNAIQLCAKECSSGRLMEDWELEAVIHYFNSLDFKLGDLKFSEEELAILNQTGNEKKSIAVIHGKYFPAYAATFVDPIPIENRKYGAAGNPENGKVIYEQSCMHCHKPGGVTKTVFDNKKITPAWFISYFHKYNGGAIYNITRTGTDPGKKKEVYMPIYTAEKLTDQQLEDLAAYFVQQDGLKKK